MIKIQQTVLLCGAILLSGCAVKPSNQEVHSWVTQQNLQALHETTKITPIPKEKPYIKVPFVGLANSRDSVFKSYVKEIPKAVVIKGAAVNMANPPLQRYNLKSLKLTGAMRRVNAKGWTAIFNTPTGKVYRANIGSKLGLRGSVIQSITVTPMGGITVVVKVPETLVGKTVEYKDVKITVKGT